MGQDWYYSGGGQQYGPVTFGNLQDLIQAGQITATSLVWSEGMAQWMPLSELPELASSARIGPAPTVQSFGVLGYQSVKPHVDYAGFWIRVGATILDGLILLVPMTLLDVVLFALIGENYFDYWLDDRPAVGAAAVMTAVCNLLEIVLGWLYAAIMESSVWQATLGKRICGIVVTDANGNRIEFGRATGRHFAKILSAITLCIGYMMAGWTERKQGLHDLIASTFVVYGKRGGAA